VNLLVTPEQAESLSLASNQVRIQLVLRNPLDTKTDPVPGTAMGNLFAGPECRPGKPSSLPARAFAKAAPKAFSIEVINGSKRSEKNSVLPRESSESEDWHYHRMFQRIVFCPLRWRGPAGSNLAISFSTCRGLQSGFRE
jgi:hypothetical protein